MDALEKFDKISGDRIYKTIAYDRLEEVYESGWCDNMMTDKFDRQQMVNFLVPIIRNEQIKKDTHPPKDEGEQE